MKIKWTREAELDRLNIMEYIARDNPFAAAETDELFEQTVTQLVSFPMQGRMGLVANTRELIPHENYRIVYQLEDETIWILAIVHVAQLWPPFK